MRSANSIPQCLELHSGSCQHHLEARLVDRLYICVSRFDDSFLNQFEKRIVEHHHAKISTRLHGRRYLECFSLANQVANRRRYDQNFQRGDAASALRLNPDAKLVLRPR